MVEGGTARQYDTLKGIAEATLATTLGSFRASCESSKQKSQGLGVLFFGRMDPFLFGQGAFIIGWSRKIFVNPARLKLTTQSAVLRTADGQYRSANRDLPTTLDFVFSVENRFSSSQSGLRMMRPDFS